MRLFNFLRRPTPKSGMDGLLSMFRFVGGTGGPNDPIRIEPLNRENAMAALKGPLAEILGPKDVPPSAPPSFKFWYVRGLVLKLVEEGFFRNRYGIQGKQWTTGDQMLLDGHIEMREVILADGSSYSFYFDFSSLSDPSDDF